ncbi:MAG TPA: exopolysaccharide biosynthesis protein, partial [Pseudomonadales bacterium]|nr:exopolysaccharide biosynthesis protein [Pseudomonadales bacterium]
MQKPNPASTLATLNQIVDKYAGQASVNLAAIMQDLNDRSIGMLMLLLALPNCFPTLPGESTLLSIPIMLMGVQLMLGHHHL